MFGVLIIDELLFQSQVLCDAVKPQITVEGGLLGSSKLYPPPKTTMESAGGGKARLAELYEYQATIGKSREKKNGRTPKKCEGIGPFFS